MRTSALARFTGGIAASVLGLTLLGAAPAIADEPPLPVVVDDTVTLYPGQSAQVDVLANDSSPTGDSLALCRFPELNLDKKPPAVIVAHDSMFFSDESSDPGDVMILVTPRAHGTHVIDYYVCDHTHLVPAKLTVVVGEVAPVKVHKIAGKPGRLRVTNTNTKTIRFWFGHPKALRPDGRIKIPAGKTRTVRVQRHRIVWIALIGAGSGKASMFASPGIADMGTVSNIKLKGKPLPKPKEPDFAIDEDVEDLIGRWRA
ncbi:hypothetical protein GCM10023350_45150 [Nocardioides endophyticus]|uniref:Uncharacterized protein n=1 Tax=Nocardioides endophyticus TaxID=1353775 RepID=A0ABP8ZEP9_9ACTN